MSLPNALLKSELDGARACSTLAQSHLQSARAMASITGGVPIHRLGLAEYHLREAAAILEEILPSPNSDNSVIQNSDESPASREAVQGEGNSSSPSRSSLPSVESESAESAPSVESADKNPVHLVHPVQ
jgi:hypothetical protein